MNTQEIYFDKSRQLRASLLRKPVLSDYEVLNIFTFMSANMTHFLPMVSYEKHIKIFRHYRIHQGLNGLDTDFFDDEYPLAIDGWKTFHREISKQPGIICTYHFGAYQLINYLLVQAQVPFALLVAGPIKASWQVRYPTLLAALQEAEAAGRFVLLDANDKSSLRQMYKLSKLGFHLLIYVDGLEGIVGQPEDKLEKFSFLGQQVAVPWGAAHIAHSLQVPIYTMLGLRRAKSIDIQSFPTIQPIRGIDKSAFAESVMARLYGWLGSFLIHWPEQWANWPYLHGIMTDKKPFFGSIWKAIGEEKEVDKFQYGIYALGQAHFLLRKSDMCSFLIDRSAFETLCQAWYGIPVK